MANYDSDTASVLGTGSVLPSSLMDLLVIDALVPGSQPSYQVCKTIYVDHPLGGKMAESPIKLAQSQPREIAIPGSPEYELKDAFNAEWKRIGADRVIRQTATLARVYGISSVAIIEDGVEPSAPLDFDKIAAARLNFNTLDPLNTAGSLVLNQNPNDADFLRPKFVAAGGVSYHPSRTCVLMNEQPVYIQWSNSAYGFVGRSVYQRALYPLKSYVQSMITDNAVQEKAALLVAKLKQPGSIIDQQARNWFGFKRSQLKGAKTGNVVSIGVDESIESVDLKNLRDAAQFTRENILKNIATGADMPASLINQETLAEGFGEGTEDAKIIARYIDGVRLDLQPIYEFLDEICMHRAWTAEFYETIRAKYPDTYGDKNYNAAFYEWKNSFVAKWPNLLVEPDSEKSKTDDVTMKAAIAIAEVLLPVCDPENRATVAGWLADVANEKRHLFESTLQLDYEAIASYIPPAPLAEREPPTESGRA